MSAYDSEFVESTPQPLDAFVYESGCSGGIDFQSVDVGAVVNVHTRYSHYRLVVADGASMRAFVTGGQLFPESTEVRIRRCDFGRHSDQARIYRYRIAPRDVDRLEADHDLCRAIGHGRTTPGFAMDRVEASLETRLDWLKTAGLTTRRY
jgi:hypothetical protein